MVVSVLATSSPVPGSYLGPRPPHYAVKEATVRTVNTVQVKVSERTKIYKSSIRLEVSMGFSVECLLETGRSGSI